MVGLLTGMAHVLFTAITGLWLHVNKKSQRRSTQQSQALFFLNNVCLEVECGIDSHMILWHYNITAVIGASLSKPHTSMTALLGVCVVCMLYVCLFACGHIPNI